MHSFSSKRVCFCDRVFDVHVRKRPLLIRPIDHEMDLIVSKTYPRLDKTYQSE